MVYNHSRLRWLILGLILLTSLFVTPVSASNPEVNITVSACVVGNPEGFTVTYVNDQQVDLNWTMPANAEKVMVRADVGRMPISRTNGELIYYGNGTSCSDVGVRLNDSIAPVYYRAWSETAGGSWSPLYSEGQIGGERVIFIGILGFAGILSFLAFRSAFFGLKLMAGMSWFMFFIYIQGNPPLGITEGSGAHIALMVISIGMGLMVVLAGLGRGIEQTKDRTGAFSVKTSSFNFKMPDFMRDQETVRRQRVKEDTEDYHDRIHRAINPIPKSRRKY